MSEPLIGTVNVAGKMFTVGELGQGEELRLGMLLKKMYAAESGNSYRRAKEMIEEMPRHLQGEAIAACVRSESSGELPGHDAMLMARTSPKGVALELWMRSRKHMEGVQLRECEAIVTESNCLEVLSDMIRELTPSEGGDDSKVDPLTLAVRYQREFGRLAATLLHKFGVMPSVVNEQTPHQLFDAAFGQSAKAVAPAEPADPLKVLADLNRKRAEKGLPPVSQLFGKVLTHLPNA